MDTGSSCSEELEIDGNNKGIEIFGAWIEYKSNSLSFKVGKWSAFLKMSQWHFVLEQVFIFKTLPQ